MVSYQKFTALAFEVAKRRGMNTSRENNNQLISVTAEIWNERKDELETATISEARSVLEREISVS